MEARSRGGLGEWRATSEHSRSAGSKKDEEGQRICDCRFSSGELTGLGELLGAGVARVESRRNVGKGARASITLWSPVEEGKRAQEWQGVWGAHSLQKTYSV